jgi:hypothetical protein
VSPAGHGVKAERQAMACSAGPPLERHERAQPRRKPSMFEDRLEFYGFWFLGGVVASFVTGSVLPLCTAMLSIIATEIVLAKLSN